MAKRKGSKRSFVLVTVSGGVATIWEHPGVDADVVDWDNWAEQDPTRNELAELREIAERLENRNDKAEFLRQVQELEDRGVAEDDDLEEMTKVEMADKRARRSRVPAP